MTRESLTAKKTAAYLSVPFDVLFDEMSMQRKA